MVRSKLHKDIMRRHKQIRRKRREDALYKSKFTTVSLYSPREMRKYFRVPNAIHKPRKFGVVSNLGVIPAQFLIQCRESAFIKLYASHVGKHLSTLSLFCRNLIRLHDVETFPVLSIISTKN